LITKKKEALGASCGYLYWCQGTKLLAYQRREYPDRLKGHDVQIAAHLRQVCEEFDFCLYLPSIKREVSGSVEDDDSYGHTQNDFIEEINRVLWLHKVVALDGSDVAEELEFEEDLFIQNRPILPQKPA
jgi:hypothetical protein